MKSGKRFTVTAIMLLIAAVLTGCTVTAPSATPTIMPTTTPTAVPTTTPTVEPTNEPIVATPTVVPTATPTVVPTATPTATPTAEPTASVTAAQGQESALVISKSELDGDAHFYSAEVDGKSVRVIAVKLADGSIRTAFDACQVCFDSGRGYYKQEGYTLVCQNCGNRFTLDQVGLSSGGCNPAPIGETDRTDDGTNIVIPAATLRKGAILFPG